jgi:hypothetical protein
VVGTDLSLTGTDGVISGNVISGMTAGAGIFSTEVNTNRLVISNNVVRSGRGRDYYGTDVTGMEIWGKDNTISGNIAYE